MNPNRNIFTEREPIGDTFDIEERAAQAYAMLEKRKDSEIERLRAALEYACCGIDTAYADIESDNIDKAKECLTRHSCAAESVLRQ